MYNHPKSVVFCSSGQGISESHVSASWSDQYSRKMHPNIDLHIEEIWIQRTKENPHLYNASKFRLNDIKVQYPSDEKLPHVHFLLGNTTYKEFIGTNCSPYAREIVRCCDSTGSSLNIQEYMADPLGVGSLLETSDHKFVFMKRSQTCGEAQGMIDRPGGHPEPENIKLNSLKEVDGLEDVTSDAVVQEIFSSVQCEIRDELNIPIEKLDESFLLGIVYNNETIGRPSLEFYTRCFLTSKEVYTEYMKQTQSEKEESVELIIFSATQLLSLGSLQNDPFWFQLTPSSQGAIMMYSMCHSYHQSQ